MSEGKYRVYNYRWIVLAVYGLSTAAIQLMWTTYFSITTNAWQYYGFTDAANGESAISFLSIVFMIGMITLSIPSLAAFEKFGFKKSVGFGVVLMGVSGIFRGFFGDSYAMVMIATVGFAIAQPFILNSPGLVAGKWFPESERATANSIGLLSSYIGMCIGLLLTPVIVEGGMSIKEMLILYGIIGAVVAILFVIFVKEKPETPPCPEEQALRSDFKVGIKGAWKRKDFRYSLIIFFCMFGIFNTFFTMIEPILKQLSKNNIDATEVGIIGVLILGVAIVGSFVICFISDKDKLHRRKPYMIISNIIGAFGLMIFIIAGGFFEMAIAAVLYGFFIVGGAPLVLTFAAEAAYPTSEGTSEGLLMFSGNVAGVIFLGAATLFHGNHNLLMISMVAITVIYIILIFMSKESKLEIKTR
ncbi:MFS transporter [Anaerovorax sp. IOR16]|uniref:MFS transporter n=1 Tax=Anaerovorax sp. IOR16 TaxID=2773458 RepID=UPI0019D2C111|nr:MFS transporter [Anaerovorax sp. IOR16]